MRHRSVDPSLPLRRACLPAALASELLMGLLAAGALPAFSQPVETDRPKPPPSKTEYFESDPSACQPEAIRAAYKAHLLPFADQSPAVLAQLRRLQDDMTLASLKRCVQKGLLTRPQASLLFRGLGLTLPGTPIPVEGAAAPGASQQPSPSTPSGATPSRATAPTGTAP